MGTLALQISLIGLFALGIAFFLLACWQIIVWIFKGIIHIKRRIKHEPELKEWYLVAYYWVNGGKSNLGSTQIGYKNKLSRKDIKNHLIPDLKEDVSAVVLVPLSITYLGRE